MRLLFFLFFFSLFLFVPGQSLALILVAPGEGEQNVDKRTGSFQWCEVGGAVKYVLDINRFDESIDNIGPERCSKNHTDCGFESLCTINFLRLPQGLRPDFNLPYSWKISAYNATEEKIDTSLTWDFKTAQRVVAPTGEAPSGGLGSPSGGGTPAVLENPISSKTLPQLLENVLNFLFGLAIVVLPIIILYGGILLLTAGGDPQKISQSRTILLWAVVAFAIILLARGLPTVLRNLL